MLTRMFNALLRIFKGTGPRNDDESRNDVDKLPITEPVCIVLKPLVRHGATDVVSHVSRQPGELSRLFARGQLDLRDGLLVSSTVEDTKTRELIQRKKT